ncbi:MAG: sulfite exporter TauE/SafE family protein [bacterium]
MITVPVLMSLGLSPQDALGTNKLQASFGSGSASLNFILAKEVNVKSCYYGVFLTFVGASAGTVVVQMLSSEFLKFLIPFLLIAIAVYSLLNPAIGLKDRKPALSDKGFYLIFGLSIGFYDGFFGPGTGSFWAMAYLLFLGYNLKKATAYTKVMNFTSNVASLLFFLIGGRVYFSIGLSMALGQIIGARMGARFVIKKGAKFIKPIFVSMVLIITIKLLIENIKKFFLNF